MTEHDIHTERLSLSPRAQGLIDLCEPVINGMGYDCVHLEFNGGQRGLVRLYIDSSDGVTLADCTKVSKQLSTVFDVEDPISGNYTLEVSSPGLNRPLGRASDFEAYAGESAKITTQEAINGQRKWKGTILGLQDGQVSLKVVDGTEVQIAFNNIAKANIEYNFEASQR